MPRIVAFDFTDAPPAQGGLRSDRVPEGRYGLRVEEVVQSTSGNGNAMFTFQFRTENAEADELNGRRIVDRFTMSPDSKFPLQRLHACLLALGLQIKTPTVRVDLDRLAGKHCIGDIVDERQEASKDGKYPERINSKPNAYYPIETAAGAAGAAPAQVAAPPPPPVAVDADVLDAVAAETVAAPPATNGAAPAAAPAADVDVAALSAEMDEVLG